MTNHLPKHQKQCLALQIFGVVSQQPLHLLSPKHIKKCGNYKEAKDKEYLLNVLVTKPFSCINHLNTLKIGQLMRLTFNS